MGPMARLRNLGDRWWGTWLPPLVLMAIIFALSAQPSLDSGLGTVDEIGRKVAHFAVYAALTYLWWRALRGHLPHRRAAIAAFVLSSAYAVSDEYHQTFVQGRTGSGVDWAIDSAGAAVAALRLGTRERAAAR
jgi:VanZ family protein